MCRLLCIVVNRCILCTNAYDEWVGQHASRLLGMEARLAHAAHQMSGACAQAPLQPLQDNLELQTYETFEKDTTKYSQYEEAVLAALLDRVPDAEAAARETVLMVAPSATLPKLHAQLPACRSTGPLEYNVPGAIRAPRWPLWYLSCLYHGAAREHTGTSPAGPPAGKSCFACEASRREPGPCIPVPRPWRVDLCVHSSQRHQCAMRTFMAGGGRGAGPAGAPRLAGRTGLLSSYHRGHHRVARPAVSASGCALARGVDAAGGGRGAGPWCATPRWPHWDTGSNP